MIREVPCFCGGMATVEEWNSKGIAVMCQNCGYIELERDLLFKYGMYYYCVIRDLEKFRKMYEQDWRNEDLDDDYRNVCQLVMNEMDEILDHFVERKKEEFKEINGEDL